ncbi:acyl carrier protein [Streptomyces sp. SL13]|uniref:Acyl carrier protein n=1 Tax=Streptantibioticus silvisoli TaxID=2705255 RepID=A0AA90H2G5_9ACTN|nr:acyl carrier protein [Streptantibioticus silvisoli]MDI5963687.1 acyl carrier protein [Streptantibioticus silvisoli]MDI5969529.1 acyl carrier protein [Streptantibioticus silvisoli]
MPDTLDLTTIENFVTDALVELGVERSDIAEDAVLDELEIDSLDMVELSQSIKKQLGIPVKPKDFDDVDTVGEVLALCRHKAGLE